MKWLETTGVEFVLGVIVGIVSVLFRDRRDGHR
jgi:hypothetical protein